MNKKYKIGEVAKLKNTDAQTLRYYDRLGLLKPEIVDERNSYRYYSERQFIDVDRIKFYKQIGMSLDEVKKFKDLSCVDDALDVLKGKQRKMLDELLRIQIVCNNIDRAVCSIEKAQEYEVEDIHIEYREDFYGIRGRELVINNIVDFENELLNLSMKYPEYAKIGNNFGLVTIHSTSRLYDENYTNKRKTMLRIDAHYKNEPAVQFMSIGRCVVTYIKSPKLLNEELLKKMREFVQQHHLIPKKDIYITPVINRFIVENSDDFLYEVIMPIESV